MRSFFKLNLFQEYLQEEFTYFEYKFLKKVFSQAGLTFGIFGLLVCAIGGVWSSSLQSLLSSSWTLAGALAIFLIISGISLLFYYLPRYHSNPLDVSPKFVRRAYVMLIMFYACFFIPIFSLIGSGNLYIPGMIFGSTMLVYFIPVIVGLFLFSHSKALKLARFLKVCYTCYFALFVIGLFLMIFALGSSLAIHYNLLFLLLHGVIVFVSPVLSIYRMKMVVKHLDEEDPVAIQKWALFFVFEILVQLMQIAVYICRFVMYLMATGNFNSISLKRR